MTSKERFYATIARQPVDRPAVWMSAPIGAEMDHLCNHYGVKNWHELQVAAGDDVYAVDIPYDSGYATSIAAAFNWYEGSTVDPARRTLSADGCFKDAEELEDLAFFEWPDPVKYIDAEELRRRVAAAPKDRAILLQLWSAHFQDACASFGMETALMNMAANPELYLAVDEKVTNFYLRANEFIYETCKDLGDAVIFANDFGSQIGLLISKKMIHDYVMPSSRKLVEQAHAYGKKVIYHSCGAVMDAYDEMLDIGVDVIHPVQVTAKGVDIRKIKEQYGDRASFCGAVDIQYLLPNGTPEEVKATVRELREIFPTGLVISPSQGVLLDDVPPANIQAMLEAAKEIY